MKELTLAAATVLLVAFCSNHPLALVRAQGSSSSLSSSDSESSSWRYEPGTNTDYYYIPPPPYSDLNFAFNYETNQGFTFYQNPDESTILAYRGYFQSRALSSEELQATTTDASLSASWTSCNNSVYQPPSDALPNNTIYTVQCGLEEAACEQKTYSVALIKIYSNGTEEFVVSPRVLTYSKTSDSCHLATVLLIVVIVVVVCAIGICACIGACIYCCRNRPSAPPPAQQPPQVVVVAQQQPVQGQVVEMKSV